MHAPLTSDDSIINLEVEKRTETSNSLEFQKRTCEANAAGESKSFIFTVYVKLVSLNHFRLPDYVIQSYI